MNNEALVLVVEDEPQLAKVLCEYLEHAGMRSHHLASGETVVQWVKDQQPSLIILDLMLPGVDGLSIFRDLRSFCQIPVIMATAKVDEIDRLLGLELGADDYICKPYSPREVVARVKNILRRSSAQTITDNTTCALQINDASMQALLNQQLLPLTPAEYRLLSFLYKHPNHIFSRDQLMGHIYSDGRVVTDRTIDSHIKNLRKKMHDIDSNSDFVKSIYSVGYMLEM
ncbi:response regulator [Alginatibacterium sediminis]|uniref:Response regulator n=1 Tax=Alginatibacterium sediminis TaxID=2164068 RepID=A0A420E8N7_9ALTE|nr:response regulator [Alginatibacterium sediminis]RKF15780.1 response regulator [Alginatibacterium sediminis]